MLVSRIHLTVSAGLKRRLTVDIQTLTQSIRSMLSVCLLYPDTAELWMMGSVGQVSLLVASLCTHKERQQNACEDVLLKKIGILDNCKLVKCIMGCFNLANYHLCTNPGIPDSPECLHWPVKQC